MKSYLTIIFTLACLNFAYTQNHWFLKAGVIHSTFKELDEWEKIDPISEFGYGIGREWTFSNNFYLSVSIDFLEKGGKIRDKTIRPLKYLEDQNVYYNDILVHIKYFEIPIYFKHGFDLGNNFSLKLSPGITISLPTTDNSEIKKKRLSFSLDDHPDRTTDYGSWQESGFGNYPLDLVFNFGFEIVYKKFALNINYATDNRGIIWVDSISEIYKTMHSYQAFLIYYL